MKKIIPILLAGTLTISATSTTLISSANPSESTATQRLSIVGDINEDGVFNLADIMTFQGWLLGLNDGTPTNSWDIYADGKFNTLDLCVMKQTLLSKDSDTNYVSVSNSSELKSALSNAKAGDEIVLKAGTYIYDGTISKWVTFAGKADGTEDKPIILRSEDPSNPAVIDGTTTESNYGLTITGDWWTVQDIDVTNAAKGIIVDNSNHTNIINCHVYNIGGEAIHLRDGSSYCVVDNCNIHDIGKVSPGFGEGVYIGSAKSTTGYKYECDYNTVKNCKIGPFVGAECIDIKEYTTGTIIENCTFDAEGCSGENYTKAFVNIKGNDCILRYCTGYRNGCEYITRAFEQNDVVDGWGQNALVYGNKAYMDTAKSSTGKMYFLNSWDCSCTVWDNFMAYEGDLFTVDNEEDHWDYYNCNLITYGE